MNWSGLRLSLSGSLFVPANKFPAMHLRLAIAFLSLVFLAGCASTPDRRIGQAQAEFNQLPPTVQQQIRAGQVDIGFTETMVWMALGEPSRKVERVSAQGVTQVWYYARNAPRMSFGFGVGSYGRRSAFGTSVSTSTGGYHDDEAMRVEFVGGRVARVEYRKG
jgi:hypothetical protein